MAGQLYIDGYADAKLCELVEELFCDVRGARERLSENPGVFLIAASDFKESKHQTAWTWVQGTLKKRKNIGLVREPVERVTVRNTTLEQVLRTIWNVYRETRKT